MRLATIDIMHRALLIVSSVLLTASIMLADPVKLARPVHVDLLLKSDPKQKISADAISYDDTGVIVKTKSAGESTYRWIDLAPSNAFITLSRPNCFVETAN